MNEVTLLIAGKDRPSGSGAWFERHDPVTGVLASRAAAATVGDVRAAADAAARAWWLPG